jgi:hypothetical protein
MLDFKIYCEDKYRYGDIVQQVKYKYLCGCNNREDYLNIRNQYNKEYFMARRIYINNKKNMLIEGRNKQKLLYRILLKDYVSLANNKFAKRQLTNIISSPIFEPYEEYYKN